MKVKNKGNSYKVLLKIYISMLFARKWNIHKKFFYKRKQILIVMLHSVVYFNAKSDFILIEKILQNFKLLNNTKTKQK